MESRDLLGVCLKHVKGISKERLLVDAGFIWTEPHSKELKLKLVLQQEVMGGLVMQQNVVVELRIQGGSCSECHKSFTRHFWESSVQVRQRSGNRRTLQTLEQLIIEHNAHTKLIKCEPTKEGLDFFFKTERDAQVLVAWIKSWAVVRHRDSKQFISQSVQNATHRFKRTTFMELCPVCRDDLVWLPSKAAQALGGLPPLLLCTRSVSLVGLLEPASGRSFEVSSADYWKRPFTTVCSSAQLTEFVVLDVTPLEHSGPQRKARGGTSQAVMLCEVEVARVSDFGVNEERTTVRSHLGQHLNPSDIVLGYDLRTVNHGLEDDVLSKLPLDIYLVKKQKHKSNKQTANKKKKPALRGGIKTIAALGAKEDEEEEEEELPEQQQDNIAAIGETADSDEGEDEDAQEAQEISAAATQMLDALGREANEGAERADGEDAECAAGASVPAEFSEQADLTAPAGHGEEISPEPGTSAPARVGGYPGTQAGVRQPPGGRQGGRERNSRAGLADEGDGDSGSGEGTGPGLAKGRSRRSRRAGGRGGKSEQQP